MSGKKAAAYKGKNYRNYWCSRATKFRALCATYNGHSAPKLEQAVLDYLGEFSDPELVKQHLALGQAKEMEQKESELAGVSKALTDLEGQFLQHLDLLKRSVLSEAEFTKANEVARSQSAGLEARREELSNWLEEQLTRVSTAERLPGAIKSFLADFESLDVRHQKAQLQSILKSSYVFRDERIELEFRG